MLPTEAFAEAVAFLRPFDMNALAVTSAMCFSIAVKASARIRWEEFPGLAFHIFKKRIEILLARSPRKKESAFRLQSVASLRFASKNETTEFVDAAIANCLFENLAVNNYARKDRMDAIGRVASSVIVKGFLLLDGSINLAESLGVLRRFRKVKVSYLTTFTVCFFPSNAFCRRSLLMNPAQFLLGVATHPTSKR